MSELKRVAPQTLEFSTSLSNATKKEKSDKGKQLAPSFRFELLLDDKNEIGYTEFTYSHLLKAAEKKRNKELKNSEENAANGLDPFDDDDDHEKLREIARRFETKYGGSTVGKNRKKYDDDVDLGAGYDENDSFIDNTDAYDEVVPEGVTTLHGGFYINSGLLEFDVNAAKKNSLMHRNNNNNNNNNENDSSESSEDEIENSNSSVSKRRDNRSIISSSDEDDTEEIVSEPPSKKTKIDENGDKKTNRDDITKKKKKLNEQELENDNYNKTKPNIEDKRESVEIDITNDNPDDKKKSKCDINKKDKKFDIKKFEKKSTTNGIDDKKILEIKKPIGKDSNIDDAIESVVNDGRIDDESSRDTIDSTKSRGGIGTSSEGEENDRSELSLIEQLPNEVREIINKIKELGVNHKEGKIKFFDSRVNSTLLQLEKKLKQLDSPTARSQVYNHLGYCLDISKLTLINRAKKLCVQDAESRVNEPTERLRKIIEKTMPIAVEKFNADCQRLTEDKSFPASISDADSSEVDDKTEKSKIPRKRFPWTSETRKLVCEIATLWREYYAVRKPRKQSVDAFVSSYFESKVLPLWPAGWMRLETLLKYANLEQSAKRKQKKQRDATVPNNVSSTSVPNSSVSVEITNTNNIVTSGNQERTKTPTNFSKTFSDNNSNFGITSQSTKTSSDLTIERKQNNIKYKEKHKEIISGTSQTDNTSSVIQPVGKISLVPTAQLMAQKPKLHNDKFNPMDLTSSSLSITPVNDYQKSTKTINDMKKDTVSITPYSESSIVTNVIHEPTTHTSNKSDNLTYSLANQNSTIKPVSLKQRILQDNIDGKIEKRYDERDCEKKRDRWLDDKHKSHDAKKRRKESKTIDQNQSIIHKNDATNLIQHSLLTREEQEQRQIEETMAATNYLSQIINDDLPRSTSDKRKDNNPINDDGIGIIQPSEQEKDVQMVMRSLRELQELQLPKSSNQYGGYNDDYHRIHHKKDEKLRLNKDDQW